MSMDASAYSRDGIGPLAKLLGSLPRILQAPSEIIEMLPLAVFACDAAGRPLWFNRSATELWQSAPARGEASACKLYFAGGENAGIETPIARVLKTATPILGAPATVERPDGARVSVMAHVQPVENERGELIGVIGCCLDTTAVAEKVSVAEQALREQNRRLAVTYEHATVGIAEIDAEGKRLRVNATACAITGRSREELLGGNVFDVAHPEDRDDDLRQYRRVVAGDIDRYSTEKRMVRKDGTVIWASVMCSGVRDSDGKFLYAVRIFQDVTEAKRAADSLAESEQRLAATYEHASIAISEVDAQGRLLRVNEATCAITGYSREELLGLTVFDVTHPDDRESDVGSFERHTVDAGTRYAVEKRLIRKDGRVIWISVTSTAVRDSAGRFLYGIRVMRDITSHRRAQEALAASERRFRELLEALPAAVYTTDAAGRITFYNQAAVELAGHAPEIGSDERWITRRLYRPDGTPLPHEEFAMAITLRENRLIRGGEALVERPDRTRVPFIPYPTPLRDETGELVGAVNMLVDISERRQAEANQKVLLDELNHRVKNNMQMLHSLLRTAQRETQSAEARAVLADAGQRVGAMAAAQQVLYEAGNATTYRARDFLEGVCAGARHAFTSNINIVVSQCAPELLSNDTAMPLALILNELLTNAAKYGVNGRGEGSIRVRLTKGLDSFELTVEDDGPGFELGEASRRSSGLGLVSGLARQLGGALKVERAPGARCRVQFVDRGSML
jgi:PAS domain S-box-containing protein